MLGATVYAGCYNSTVYWYSDTVYCVYKSWQLIQTTNKTYVSLKMLTRYKNRKKKKTSENEMEAIMHYIKTKIYIKKQLFMGNYVPIY